ncbi:protein kinase [Nocardiopsis sp. RSe5-2]|uniref:Protein kinase n=1 Tax=Nocardiopsis endophytica TaxID=3018445 RepID=A0ABT4U2N9_9ACTN|nr:protein kinase [Nocardiopsis endophytica]MDA2811218.1 protein kinase [Nocardiopsis endophytica]
MASPLHDGDPSRLGPYDLVERLGIGGMGHVFLGRSRSGRLVAVKAVRPELANDAAFRRRFATEVSAARRVGGFYTAQVVDAAPDAEPPWMATAFVPGPSLHQAVTDHGPLPPASVAVLGAGLAEGLAAVHACEVVHRDLKPANVILAEDGPRLIDFGIARALDTTSQTQTSTVLGTASFMSPEQARAQEVGPPSDVFSLGCVLAYAATGRSPFGDGPSHAIAYRIVHESPDLEGIPAHLAELVGSCLAKDPDHRPDLEQILDGLTAPALGADDTGQGGWLPQDLTEVVTRRRTLALTAVGPGEGRDLRSRPRTPAPIGPVPAGRPQPLLAEERVRTRPIAGYRNAVYALLALFAFISVAVLLRHLAWISQVADPDDLEQRLYETVFEEAALTYPAPTVLGMQVVQFASCVGAVVCWLLWFHRVRLIAERFAPGRLRYEPRMAVASWFIPVGNLFLPKQIADDVWHASSPPGNGGGMAPAGALNTWWSLWLFTFLTWPIFWTPWWVPALPEEFWEGPVAAFTFVAYRFVFIVYQSEVLVWSYLALQVLVVPAAIGAGVFVHRLTAMQEARLRTDRGAIE